MEIKHHGFAITFVALVLLASAAFTQQVRAAAITTDTIGTFIFSQNLQLWERGEDIRSLQTFLNAQGYFVAQSGTGSPGNESTLFGLRTLRALARFQAAHGLPATGFFGPQTRGVISLESNTFAAPSNSAPPSAAIPSTGFTPNAIPAKSVAGSSTPPIAPFALINYSPGFGGGGSDTIPPVISGTPSNITAEATSGSGATVSYTSPTATDNVDGAISVSCAPASGSTFAISATTITCSATDRAGNSSSSTFTVTVQDTTAPTVSMTAPANGATVSGSLVTLSANASDAGGVAGVQFKVNGVSVGSEDTSSPYSITWNSTATSSGSKSIVAVARDAAGNYATSTTVTVTLDNIAPIISTIASSTDSSSATITWTTDEAANSQVNYGTTVSYGSASSSAALATSHSITLTGLTAGTIYHFQIQSTDGQSNTATSSDQTFTTAYTGAFAALQLAKTRRVDFVYVADSNGQYNGWGWASGFTVALGNKYGLYASPVYPQESSGTALSTAGNPPFNAISNAVGATTGAPSAQAPFALPYASYLFQTTTSIGNNNGLTLHFAPTDANGAAFNAFNSAANLRYWMGYGTFASGGGSFKPGIRKDVSPFSTLVTGSTINVQTGVDGQGITHLDLSAGVRANDIGFRWQLPGGTASVASTTELWQRLENQDASAGISVTQLYAVGGKDLYDYATTFNGYTQTQWTNYFNAVTYQQVQDGQSPTVVIFINSGDNDINDSSRTSIGPIGGLANNTAAGYADNLAAVVNTITAAWTGAGLPVGNNGSSGLYFLIVPSHVYSSPDISTLVAMRAAAATYAAGKSNMSFVDIAALVPYSELIANGGYSAAPHLNNTTYQYIATKLVNTFLH